MAAVQAHLEGRAPVYEVENRLRLKSGAYRYNFACGKVVEWDADGDPLRMVGSDTDITERKQTEDVLTFLGQHDSATSSQGFFELLAKYLAEKLGMDFVCIDRLEGDGLTARTVAFWFDGKFEDNVTYALKDTPCGDVVGKAVCCFPASVCRYFPKDIVLKDMNAESYVGVTLWSHDGKPIGLIAVIGRNPLDNRPLAETMLKTVAVRAGAELERLAAEASLRESEMKYRLLTESIQDVVWTLDTRTMRFLYISPSVQNLRGFTPEEILASPIHAALTPQTGELVKARIQQRVADFLSGKEPPDRFYINEIEQPCKDGSTVWTEAVTSYYRNEKTGAVEVRGVTRNISARKRAEEQLRAGEIRLQAIIESTADGILAVDNQGKVVKANRRFAELWRVPSSLMARGDDQALLEFVMGQLTDPDAFLKKVQSLYKSDVVDVDMLLFKDGRIFERVSIPMVMDGVVAGRVWSFRDITRRKQAEDALRQKISELEQFNALTVDREMKMIELKEEVNALMRAAGQPEKYRIVRA
jgi:PAS domain S-box-containing protein